MHVDSKLLNLCEIVFQLKEQLLFIAIKFMNLFFLDV